MKAVKGYFMWIAILFGGIQLQATDDATTTTSLVLSGGLPNGCTVTDVQGGKKLYCHRAVFYEVVPTLKQLGDDIIEVYVGSCKTPLVPVYLNESCFGNSTSLKRLTIWSCGIEGIQPDTFRMLGHLELLNVGDNAVKVFTEGTFLGLNSLKDLSIHKNEITTFKTAPFVRLKNLTRLTISGNQIITLGNCTFRGLTNLKYLDLEYNLILKFQPETLHGLACLEYLSLASNRINSLYKGTFQNLKNLRQLRLDSNNINLIETGVLQDLGELEVLDLDNNYYLFYIKTRHFAGLAKLRSLSMKNVGLGVVDQEELKYILEDQVDSLKELFLLNTEFTNRHLPLIKHLKHIEKLDLSLNRLGYLLDSSLPQLAKNSSLDLNDNKLFYIDDRALEGMRNSSVRLDGNSFHCTCKLATFARWLRTKGSVVKDADQISCIGPIEMYEVNVIDYDPFWWQCSPYVPLVALVFILGFVFIVALVILVVYCNRINLKHWLAERQVANQKIPAERKEQPAVGMRLGFHRNSLRQGKTGAYVIYDFYDRTVLNWANKYLEDQLFTHPLKITLQWPAGPDVIPLWKQIKDFSVQVNAFLVLVTDDFLESHWPEITEKSGVENIMKCVLVLHGKKKSDLPKEMGRLHCPCYQWPETGTRFTTLERERDQFWKQLRLAIKGIPK